MDRIPNLPNEVWKPIDGYEKYYVSSLGRIKSLKHKKEKILTAFPNNKGYYRVCLSHNGVSRHFLVSRLVAAAFCENDDPQHKNTVDHIDGDVSNNKASNLRFLSQQDNYRAYCEKIKKTKQVKKEYESNTET